MLPQGYSRCENKGLALLIDSADSRAQTCGMKRCHSFLLFGLLGLAWCCAAADKPVAVSQVLAFETHTGYFVSNQFEPATPTSFVVLTEPAAFDKMFGVAMVMQDKSHRLAPDAFSQKLVVAAIHRGKMIVEYKVEQVTAERKTLTIRYTTKSEPNATAEFACPLIISIAKAEYDAVRFFENGQEIKQLALPVVPSSVDGVRMFVAGHSFHQGIIPWLDKIARNAGITNQVLVGKLFVGGSRTIRVWETSATQSDVRTVLQAGQVDVLTLSPHRLLPDPGVDKFVDFGLAGNPNLRVTVQQSWIPYDKDIGQGIDPDPEKKLPIAWDVMTTAKLLATHQPYFRELEAQVRAVNARCGKPVVFLVPTGNALIVLREKVRLGLAPGIKTQAELFRDRMGHPGTALTLLNAYCHFAVIYRRSPVGLAVPGLLPDVSSADSEALNRLLQEIAWAVVTTDPLSGVPSNAPENFSDHSTVNPLPARPN
jgi:hypothetical protein